MIFLLKKVIGNFLVIPGLFIIFSGLIFVLIVKKRYRPAKFFSLILFTSLYFFSTEPGRDFLLRPLESKYSYPNVKEVNCSYIVVLGGGITENSPNEGGNPSVRADTLYRLYEAFKVWKERGFPIVVTGGKVTSEFAEAPAMKKVLINLGVPSSKILVEDRSRTTFENALYTAKLIGREEICLVTSAYHMPRSVAIFKSFGFKVIPIPTDYKVRNVGYSFFSFLPFPGFIKDSITGFREWVGIAFFEIFSKWRAREDSNLRPTD